MLRDVWFGIRMLARQPGVTAITALTLALGIGATAAVFSLIQGTLLATPPYPEPHRLVLIPSTRTDGQASGARGWPAAQWVEWHEGARSFEGVAGYRWSFNFLIDADGSESLEGMRVTRDYFGVMGLEAALGRTFDESEMGTPPAPVIIIGHALWQRRFNGDPHVIGKSIRLSRIDTPQTIVGVMPRAVRFLPSPGAAREPNYDVNETVDFWMPAGAVRTAKEPSWDVVARLKAGVTVAEAQAELAGIAARQARADMDFLGWAPALEPLIDEMNRDGRRILLPLLGAAALVLLIACGNAAALLLVRGLQRQQEYALRRALGVSRLALFRQVATESLLLALLGGTLGAGLAVVLVIVFKNVGGHAVPRLDAVVTGWPVLASGLGTAVVAAVLAGFLPAFRASRLDPMGVLRSSGSNTSAARGERRLLGAVTFAQTTLTLALLVGAGLLIRTMGNIASVSSGDSVDRILTMTVTAVQGDWSAFHVPALERVSAVSGVQGAAFAWGVPLTGNNWPAMVEIEGQPVVTKPSDRVPVPLRSVTPGYFALLGQTIVDGRDFRATDARGAPMVAVVNKALADRYFPDANAIGKKIWTGPKRPPLEIVGIVSNSRTDDLTHEAAPEIYFSLWQQSAFSKDLVVRTAGDPSLLVDPVRRALHSLDPTVAVENVRTLEQIRDESLASRTFAMQLLIGFSVVASVLTAVGIYGVLSLVVASRRRELAIRTAIGADGRSIRNLVFAEGFRMVAAGIVSGLATAFLLSRVLQSLLFDVEPGDPATLTAAGLLFAIVAALACWAPTRRAMRVDPIEALRYE